MDMVIWIVGCLFASIGIVQAAGWLYCRVARPMGRSRGYQLFSLPTDPDQLEAQLRYSLLCRKWNGGLEDSFLILLDHGLDEEGQRICQKMLEGVLGVFICTPREVAGIVSRLDDLQKEARRI